MGQIHLPEPPLNHCVTFGSSPARQIPHIRHTVANLGLFRAWIHNSKRERNMTKTPQEVEAHPIYGTSEDDIILDTETLSEFFGLQGDDVFMASENDAYGVPGYYTFIDDYFHGGSGSDTISYQLSDKKIMANLKGRDMDLVNADYGTPTILCRLSPKP